MIHLRDVLELMEEKDRNGKPLPFQVKFVKKSTGEVRELKQVVMRSANWKTQTRTLEDVADGQLRECCIRLFVEFNGERVRF